MTLKRTSQRFALVLVSLLGVAVPGAKAQDSLSRAKEFYASASYEEALAVLSRLRASSSTRESTEIAAYQVFCLMALGRPDDARQAIEGIVQVDPLYHPSESLASPRMRTTFEDVRRRMLPDIVKSSYAKGKEAFDQQDLETAATQFDLVLSLLDEPGVSNMQGITDLRTLASGFRDLSKVKPPPAPPAATPAPSAAVPTTSAPVTLRVYWLGDENVTRPVPIVKALPPWHPTSALEAAQEYVGILEVIIDESGSVTSARLRKTVHPIYDKVLLQSARKWKFRPATKDGIAVKYREDMEIRLTPRAS